MKHLKTLLEIFVLFADMAGIAMIIAVIFSLTIIPAFSAQAPITQISGTQASVGALKGETNTRFSSIQSNFVELYSLITSGLPPCNNSGDIREWDGDSWECAPVIDFSTTPPILYNNGNFYINLDTDLSSTSANNDTVPSAKATKAAIDAISVTGFNPTIQTDAPTNASPDGWYLSTSTGSLYNVAQPHGVFTYAGTLTANDTTPTAFSFTDEVDVPADGGLECGEAITVLGINYQSPISTSGGDLGAGWKVNGGTVTSTPSTVSLNDSVVPCVYRSLSNSTPTNAPITIGGVTDIYTVTTAAPGVTCNGTQSFITGYVEGFENGTGAFCTSEFSIPANVDGAIISTVSTNLGTLIDTHSLEIFDTTSGNHRNDAVRVALGSSGDNDWSLRFKYKIEAGPTVYNTIPFLTSTSSSTDAGTGQIFKLNIVGNGGAGTTGPFRMQISTTGGTNSAYVKSGIVAGTTVCVEMNIHPNTGATNTSTIKVFDSDCTSNVSQSTFEITPSITGSYIWFGGVADDTDPHHYGIDAIEFKAAGGAF